MLKRIWGADVLISGFLPKTASDGKVTYNSAGTLGTLLAVYSPFWAMGWKRHIKFGVDESQVKQSRIIVCTFRLGFLPRGAGAATATINLGVGV